MGLGSALTGGLSDRFSSLSEDKRSQFMDPLDIFGQRAGRAANEASLRGAAMAAQGEKDKLDYLKEVEALPLELRNKFLPQLADVYSGGQGQQDLIDSAQSSPLYNAIMGGQSIGEDTVMRNASMTGGFRSGDAQANLTDYGSQLQNQALLESYNQQLQGMSGLARIPLNTNQVAGAMAGPSGTLAQGYMGGQQAIQQSRQQGQNNAMAIGGSLLKMFSDARLKDDVEYIGVEKGHDIFSWAWNKRAEKLGLKGRGKGVMAHLVSEYMPEAISTKSGYLVVDYGMLARGR